MIDASTSPGVNSVPAQAPTQSVRPITTPQSPQQGLHPPQITSEESLVAEEGIEQEGLYEEEEEKESEKEVSLLPASETTLTPRKRSSGDLEGENSHLGNREDIRHLDTPPKRARTALKVPSLEAVDANCVRLQAPLVPSKSLGIASIPRQRKRSSEELEMGGSTLSPAIESDKCASSHQKRLRVELSSGKKSMRYSLSTSPLSSVTAVSSSEEELKTIGGC